MSALNEEFTKFDKKIWRTIGARFNAYRRLRCRQDMSIFSISILSLYLMVEPFIPEGTLSTEAEEWRKAIVVLSSVFILILSLLEARKSYELKAERLHNNAMVLNKLYDLFKIESSDDEKKKIIRDYHLSIASCPENHEPSDEALFRASHRHEFNVGFLKAICINVVYFIQTYWLYITLMLLPPLAAFGLWVFSKICTQL